MPPKQINKAGRYIISKGRLSGHPHGIYEQTRALKVNPGKTIEKRLLTLWPQLKGVKITHCWGGTDGISRDEMPLIGVMGEYNNIYYGVGYSGEGVEPVIRGRRYGNDPV